MGRLIDADKLYESIAQYREDGAFGGGRLLCDDVLEDINLAEPVEAEPVRHGKWLIEAHKEKTNNRWNVTAECSECAYDLGEIWAGFFPGIPDGIAENVCFNSAKSVDVGNYCPNCGAKMG